jgi:hypothetical protein
VPTTLGRKTVLLREIENSLRTYCIDMDARYFDSSTANVLCLAYQLAIMNGLPRPAACEEKTGRTQNEI